MDKDPIIVPIPEESFNYTSQEGEAPPTPEIARAIAYSKAQYLKGIDDARDERLGREGGVLEAYQQFERDITALAAEGHPFGLWAFATHRAGIYLSMKKTESDPQFGNPKKVAEFDHFSKYWQTTADLLEPDLATIK